MAISLFDAATKRWDAKGMNTVISPLRLDKEGGPDGMQKSWSSSPADEPLPRSRFAEASAELEDTTSASKVYFQHFILTCYSLDLEKIKEYQDLIIDNFENAHAQSADQFSLVAGEGCVRDLDYVEMQKAPLEAELKYVEIVFRCRYTVPRVLPN